MVLPRVFSSVMLLSVLALACDPTFLYRPTSGTQTDSRTWSTEVDGVEIWMKEYENIVGVEYFSPHVHLLNPSSESAVLEGARLITESGEYETRLPDGGELKWRRARPGSQRRVDLFWGFDEPATAVLGERLRLVLELRIGEEMHQVEVEYERVE